MQESIDKERTTEVESITYRYISGADMMKAMAAASTFVPSEADKLARKREQSRHWNNPRQRRMGR